MPTEAKRSTQAILSELETEKVARQNAEARAESHRRLAESFERVSAALIAEDAPEAFLRRLLEIFVASVDAEVACLRVREGEVLRCRAAVGAEENVTASFSGPVDDASANGFTAENGHPGISSVAADDSVASVALRKAGALVLYRVRLVDAGVFVGDVHVGFRERQLSDSDRQILGAIGRGVGPALGRANTYEALRQAVRSRDEVLSVVAHDLRNPLNVISIAASTLLQRLPDSATRRPLDRIIRGAQRADRMVRDLLEIDAMERGRFSIESRRVEPADLILSALESQQSLAAEASVIIATDLSPELPPVDADEERLLEVLENLIGNAIKFTSPGDSITVGASLREGEVQVSVKDNGTGIAADQLPHIFDRFWQAKKAERRGTGLGLTICKGIVEAHGGSIWAESGIGVGTTMFFTIPATRTRDRKADVLPIAGILLVDDRPENLLSLKAILERPDYRLVTAATGAEALGIALRETFAVALIDIAMPGMSGLEVAYHLKELERSRDIPIIFVTAFGDDPEEIHRAYSAGGADYLVKPLDAEIVRKKVAVFVELSRKRLRSEPTRRPRVARD